MVSQQVLQGFCLLVALTLSGAVMAQSTTDERAQPLPDHQSETTDDLTGQDTPIQVEQAVPDTAISNRILQILETSGWFESPRVEVKRGIALLHGVANNPEHREWAGQIARRTEQVVAVVNRIQVTESSPWDLQPAFRQMRTFTEDTVRRLPIIVVSVLIFILFVFIARRLSGFLFSRLVEKIESTILRQLIARLSAIPIMVFGAFLVLTMTGLGSVAATLIGGTGLVGLVIGIAFRDITENFLASILISVQRPFRLGDLIRVKDFQGFVEAITTRGTVLLTLEGNHVQIPNSIIYKDTIINYSTNPTTRLDFIVGIGYDVKVARAQAVALTVLEQHPAVLEEPEPMILAEELMASTVNLRIYFWIDTRDTSVLKVRSSVIRLIKNAFIEAGITMPDDAREVVFPDGIALTGAGGSEPVLAIPSKSQAPDKAPSPIAPDDMELNEDDRALATCSEGRLISETPAIRQQAKHARMGDNEINLVE